MTLKLSTPSWVIAIFAFILCCDSLGRAQLVKRPLITARHAVVTSDDIAAPVRSERCEDLTKLNLPGVAITSSTDVPAGEFTPPGSSTALETPEFCRVVAVAKPTSDSVINFEVWIPPAAHWNHNFLGRGNGG